MESVLIAASFVLSLLLILSFIFRKNRKRKAQEGQPETAENERTIEKDKQKKFRRAGFFALIIVVTVGLWNELTSVDKQIVRCNLTGNNELTAVLETYSPLVLLWSENGRRGAVMNGFLGPIAFSSENTSYIETFEIWKFNILNGRIRVKIDLLQMEAAVMRDLNGKTQNYYGECR